MFIPGSLSSAVWNHIVKKTEGKSNHKAVGKELFNVEFDGGIAYIFKWVSIVCGCLYSFGLISYIVLFMAKLATVEEMFLVFAIVLSQVPFFAYAKKIQKTYYIFTENEVIYCEGGKERSISYERLRQITKKKKIRAFTKYIIPLEHRKLKINRRYCDMIDIAMKYIHNVYGIPMPVVTKEVEKKVCKYYHIKIIMILAAAGMICGAGFLYISLDGAPEDNVMISKGTILISFVVFVVSAIASIIVRLRNTPKVEQSPKF